MKSRLAGGGAFVNASSASTFPAFFTVQKTGDSGRHCSRRLVRLGCSPAQAAAIAADLANYFTTLRPTQRERGDGRALPRPTDRALQPADVQDIAALKASFNNTYELGYKGILGKRARLVDRRVVPAAW